jgi:hypothetical protein
MPSDEPEVRMRDIGGAGTPVEPVRYTGGEAPDPGLHHGRLRPAVGVHSFQVLRANRAYPEEAGGFGWTYNHAPMLAFWRGRLFLEYLSGPVGEHIPPSQTLLTSSADGRAWSPPQVVFPPYRLPDGTDALMHQRMGFFVAPDSRLLVLGFYGLSPSPNDGRGLGRVAREVFPDETLGPIFFLRYNRHAGWGEANTSYRFYRHSPDPGFVAACEALLADRLVTLQWWEEDRSVDGFYAVAGEKALSSYRRSDGAVVGLWKQGRTALSFDDGATWTPVVGTSTLITGGAKVWGERTADGRYALVYNPSRERRWPLVVVTGDDGVHFDGMATVHAELPPRRFAGQYKDIGQQYVRGIEARDAPGPDDALWVAYSVNKEDLWVSRIPLPVRTSVDEPVHDTFDGLAPGDIVPGWNLVCGRWAGAQVVAAPDGGRCLELRDEDPCDHATATRVFPESHVISIALTVRAEQARGRLEVDVEDGSGRRPVRLALSAGRLVACGQSVAEQDLAPFAPHVWHELRVDIDVEHGRYDLLLDGRVVLPGAPLVEVVESAERLVLRTGAYRTDRAVQPIDSLEDLPGADERASPVVFLVGRVDVA